ncbi:hypothetical protein LTR70_007948 [Exophiala xenobiotica]|nr:hypothetical protein LTR70_007948 [Exophiala xenobiotica]
MPTAGSPKITKRQDGVVVVKLELEETATGVETPLSEEAAIGVATTGVDFAPGVLAAGAEAGTLLAAHWDQLDAEEAATGVDGLGARADGEDPAGTGAEEDQTAQLEDAAAGAGLSSVVDGFGTGADDDQAAQLEEAATGVDAWGAGLFSMVDGFGAGAGADDDQAAQLEEAATGVDTTAAGLVSVEDAFGAGADDDQAAQLDDTATGVDSLGAGPEEEATTGVDGLVAADDQAAQLPDEPTTGVVG